MDQLSSEDLLILNKLIHNKNLSTKQKEIDDLRYENFILQLKNKYKLSEKDSLDSNTGIINRAEIEMIDECNLQGER